jgi:hypothetical protein
MTETEATKEQIAKATGHIFPVGGVRLSKWAQAVGISRTTVWRLRKAGKLSVVVHKGLLFVTEDTVKKFFQNEHPVSASRAPRRE